MRIASWNVNGLRARMELVLKWLEDRQPDIVGLQELKLPDEKYPHEAIEAAGYKSLVYGQKSWNGVAILSKESVELTQKGLPGEDDFGSRLISAKQDGFHFTTVYCPNGKSVEHDDYEKKLAWFDSLRKYLDEQHDPGEELVICGDYNICPQGADSWNEEEFAGSIFHTEQERARMQSILDWGLSDTFRDKYPDSTDFSWWDYRGGSFPRNRGLRIDFLLATASTAKRVKDSIIDRDYRKKIDGLTASDHAPVWVDLE